MATIALAVAGGAVGSAVGGTILGVSAAAIGQAVGSYAGGFIDSALFGGKTKLPDITGQRLESLSIQVSTYGKTIPQLYGYSRLAGNVIWALNIKEVEEKSTTSSGGGKGGGGGSVSQTTVNYKYYATLAIAICEGEITEIARIWADAKQLSTEELQAAQGKYEVFLGTEDQAPSSIIESYDGAGNVPAYRGVSYVVIEDFPLADYGNRIPNFTFEVYRKVALSPSIEDKIKSIVIIPGSGEFVYSRDIVSKYNITQDTLGNYHQTGESRSVNIHNFQNKPDVEVSIDQMVDTFPNLEWVALVVAWFGTSKIAADCEIIPKVEYVATGATTTPIEWSVGSITRDTAQVVLSFGDGTPTYGGTPSDKSIIQTAQYLKSKGLKVMLYPFLQIDTTTDIAGEDNKPWRGRITPLSSANVTTFFTRTNGYNAFIRHYSQLSYGGIYLKDNIDAFLIGSEMVGLTGYDSGGNTYPAVTAFKTLAANVKTDLGAAIKVGYAADWSEYHSKNGYYNMDPLWTDSNIDFVGIDAYFPITPDLAQSEITEDKIKEYWEKGEGWDYYYTDPVARTGLTNYSGATYAWKNVENWWNSSHTNPSGGGATGWTAKLKPVWFTEYGFPSVDACANQPNVFYDPNSIESFFPRASKGRVDFSAQRMAINATEDFLEARNLESGNADLVPVRFVWTWDARPFPFYPDLKNVWADWNLWQTGHWINGKIGTSNLGAIVAEILNKVGLTSTDYDVSRLTQPVDGFLIDNTTSARGALELLRAVYFFDMVESQGVLKFVNRGAASAATITEETLIPTGGGNIREHFEITRIQELDLPNRITLNYVNRINNYQTATQFSQRQTVSTKEQISSSVPIVLSDQYAKQVVDISLYTAWIGRTSFNFSIPPQYAAIEVGDVITVTVNSVNHIMRVTSATMERNGAQQLQAIREDISTYDFYTPPSESSISNGQGVVIPTTELTLLDIPALPYDTGADGIMRGAVVSLGEGWKGAVIYRSLDGGESGGNTFNQIASTTAKAVKGVVLNSVGDWSGGNTFDTTNTIDVSLLNGELSSVTELAILNGANSAIIGNEILQFQNATLTGERRYTLSKLLRGRAGTEHEISTHAAGDTFVLIDSALLEITMPPASFGLQRHYKAATIGSTLTDTTEAAFTYTGKTLRPYSPVHIIGNRDGSGNLTISWTRRTRISGEWRDSSDVPLGEEKEKYEVEIMSGSTVIRTITEITTSETVYNAANQVADFGSLQASIAVRIYQISTIYGRGTAGSNTV